MNELDQGMKIGRNIFHMDTRRAKPASFLACAQIEGYWHALCQGLQLPHRSEIDPRGMESALAHTFMLEWIAPGICRFRIAGRHLNDLMGMDVRGMPLTAMFGVDARREIGGIVDAVCAEPCIKNIQLKSKAGIGRSALAGRMLLAPLLDEFSQATRILGCLETIGPIGSQPRRFIISKVLTSEMISEETPPVRSVTPRGSQTYAYANAKRSRYSAPLEAATLRRPRLQMVVDND